MRKLLLGMLMATAMAIPAKADVTLGGQNWTATGDVLTLQAVVPGGNQPQNIQCIICGANQPQQSPTFGYTNFQNGGNQSDLLFFSTAVIGGGNPGSDTVGIGYDGSFLRNFLLTTGGTLTFSVGIDVNDNGNAQTLESFFLLNLTQHLVLAAFSPGPGGTLIPSVNNGTGFPDYTLSGFDINLASDIQAGDQLIFFARISGANDGPDSFFIIPNQVAVPGPIAGAGLPGILAALGLFGFSWRRRLRQMWG